MFERSAKLEKVFRRHPGAPVFARLAETALRRDRLMRAQVLCEEGCERFPDYPTGHVILGRVYETQGLWDEARDAYDQGLRLDPDQPAVYRRLSRVYGELGNPTLALKCLESAARLDPLSESVAKKLQELAILTREQATPAPQDEEPRHRPEAPLVKASGSTSVAQVSDLPSVAPEPLQQVDAAADQLGAFGPGVETGSDVVTPASPHQDGVEDTGAEDAGPGGSAVEGPAAEGPAGEGSGDDPGRNELTDLASGPDLPAAPVAEAATEPFGIVQQLPEWDTSSAAQVGDSGPEQSTQDQPTEQGEPDHAGILAAGDDETQPPPPLVEAEPVRSVTDVGHRADIDSSEVAALGEGLFDEGEAEDDELPPPATPPLRPPVSPAAIVPSRTPGPAAQPEVTAPPNRPEIVEQISASRTADRVAPPALQVPAATAQGAETPPIEDSDPSDAIDPAAAEIAPVAASAPPAKPAVQDLLSSSPGFSRRADGTLRQLVADIQGTETDSEKTNKANALPFATVTLAQLYDRQGFGEQATRIYQEILAADPTNESALAGLKSLSTTG